MFTQVLVDLSDVLRGLDRAARREVLMPAMKRLKVPMRLDQREHAKAKSGPEGGWQPLAASTVAARTSQRRSVRTGKGRRQVPRATRAILGRLPGAVGYRATIGGITGTSRVAWSGVHQDGGTAGRGARIPARPFLWISDKLMSIAEWMLGDQLLAAFGGG